MRKSGYKNNAKKEVEGSRVEKCVFLVKSTMNRPPEFGDNMKRKKASTYSEKFTLRKSIGCILGDA